MIQRPRKSFERLSHPMFLIFVLGGLSGALVNFFVTFTLYLQFDLSPDMAFFIGTLANQLFHHLYYGVVYVNREVKLRTPIALHFFLYVCVALGSAGIIRFFLEQLEFGFGLSFFLALSTLSVLNAFFVRVSTFGSAKLAEVEYREMNDSYYDDQTSNKKVSRFRAWYHRSRYERLTEFVSEYYRKGMRIADFGCANCLWNIKGLPVTGVDINAKMLRWAKKNKRLRDLKVTTDLAETGLASNEFDLLVMSETLEHVQDLPGVLSEVRRVLKKNGVFLITVPYDFFLGPFFILFNLNCIYMGFFRGSSYHRYRCGHINHFTKTRLRNTLAENGFSIRRNFVVNGLLLYAVAEKTRKNGPLA